MLQRIAGGDETALAALYDRWAQRVYDIACWILQDPDEAEDVVEETFWQVWRTAGRYDWRRAAGSTWIAMIARSRAIDRLRTRRRGARGEAAPPSRRFPAEMRALGDDDPEVRQERADLRAALADAVGGLPTDQRQVVELAYFDGLSHSEVAARTALPLGTVKTRIRLAMRNLRERLRFLRDEGL